MNSVHDMGGMDGMGPIQVEKNEPVFHAPLGRAGSRNEASNGGHATNPRLCASGDREHPCRRLPAHELLRTNGSQR